MSRITATGESTVKSFGETLPSLLGQLLISRITGQVRSSTHFSGYGVNQALGHESKPRCMAEHEAIVCELTHPL